MTRSLLVIDPGHGGLDSGAVGPNGELEKNVNLRAARLLDKRLSAHEVQTVLTRKNDVFVSLTERSNLANRLGADGFISLHANSVKSRLAHGFEVWTSPGETRADDWAHKILVAIEAEFPAFKVRKNCSGSGLDFENPLVVLTHTKMPAVLVEMGFISNPGDCKQLQDDMWLGRLMDVITCATLSWLNGEHR